MANAKYDAVFTENKHTVGLINSSWAKKIVNGAYCPTANIDNYTLVEMDGFDTDGNRKCKPLSAIGTKGFLVSTIEEESLYFDEEYLQGNYNDFYNAKGEMMNLTIQEPWLHFECSNYSGTPKVGGYAYYNVTDKKFICVDTADATMKTAGNQYTVVAVNTDFGANLGVAPTIRLEMLEKLITA